MAAKLPGARCDECPLQHCKSVLPERKSDTRFVILGEAPGRNEVVEQRPFIGASGLLLNQALEKAQLKREHAHVTNAAACYPEKKLGPKQWTKVLNCCRPRLTAELESLPKGLETKVLAFGAVAMQQLLGTRKSIMDWFGAPLDGLPPFFPSYHPALALYDRKYMPLFMQLVKRGAAWLRGELHWVWPEIHINEDREAKYALIGMLKSGVLGVDVETTNASPQFGKLLCVGVADGTSAVSLEWPVQDEELRALLLKLLTGPAIKCFHNAQHDVLALEANGVDVAAPCADTLLMHTARHPGMKHSLSFACAQYFEAPRWKTEFHDESEYKGAEVFAKADPPSRRVYNAKDCIMGRELYVALRKDCGDSTFDPHLRGLVSP